MTWANGVKGVLLDITGVLYNSGSCGGTPIVGSVEAIQRLKASQLLYKFCSNESTQTRADFAAKLNKHGFDISADEILSPAPVMVALLKRESLRPHLLVHPDVLAEFSSLDQSNPDCVVLGDCQEHFTSCSLNQAFRVLLSMHADNRKLYALGAGKYYSENGELVLDVGSYARMLEFAADCTMNVCGKPQPAFFEQALQELGVKASECVMIGDDIVSDVGGAQAMGMRGVQVRTGKYRADADEPHPTVKPDGYVDNLAEAINMLLTSSSA
ncbi:phospholysine phosphohistidine inorganic pyrophosphate phosphatase-like [Watersipora subatra]|uniref:phospholysine phosphohistidine inorganic pyrophosphate phosphatase-like n=1 Tax=Watersipora subatra TaxID=2589382 RepID=UPI00355B77B2